MLYQIIEGTHSEAIFNNIFHSSSRNNRNRAVEWPLDKVSGGTEKLLCPWGVPLRWRTEGTILQVKMVMMAIEIYEEKWLQRGWKERICSKQIRNLEGAVTTVCPYQPQDLNVTIIVIYLESIWKTWKLFFFSLCLIHRCKSGYMGSRCEYLDLDWRRGEKREIIIVCIIAGLVLLILLIIFVCVYSQ